MYLQLERKSLARVDLDVLHSGTVDLLDINTIFDELSTGVTEHTKVLVKP